MRRAHTVEEIRAAEAGLMATLPPGTLMQRAAAGLASACADLLGRTYGSRVVVVAGSGDNGGDALWAGARLARRGARVDAIVLDPAKVHAEGLAALRMAGGLVVTPEAYDGTDPASGPDEAERAARLIRTVAEADLVLDGIVGIGGRPGLRDDAAAVMALVERYDRTVVAVDVPSGIDVDTGAAPGPHVHADLTVTFGTHKVGLLVDPGATAAGAVHLVDIGLEPWLQTYPDRTHPPVEALQAMDVAVRLPVPTREAHKYTRGVLGVLAGGAEYTGAAALAVGGALGGFAGMVRYVGPDHPAEVVRRMWPEAVIGTGRVQAWAVGSGLGAGRTREVETVLRSGVPVLIDADGLTYLPKRFADDLGARVLLTPHEGELARMLDIERDEVDARRLHHAREAARRWNATVLLKGATTVIAAPDGRVRVNTVGTPWLATAGSGDVLSGLCGSLLAAGLDPLEAGSVGAYLHGSAGVLASDGGGSITSYAIARALPRAIAAVVRE